MSEQGVHPVQTYQNAQWPNGFILQKYQAVPLDILTSYALCKEQYLNTTNNGHWTGSVGYS